VVKFHFTNSNLKEQTKNFYQLKIKTTFLY